MRHGRRALLAVHLAINATWLGAAAATLVVEAAKSPESATGIDRAVFLVREWIVFPASVLVVGTGALFALFTPWGVLRHRWVLVKWLGLFGLGALNLAVTGPACNALAALSDVDGAAAVGAPAYQSWQERVQAFTAAELALLLALFALSVWKPWGKTRLPEPRRRVARIVAVVLAVVGLGFYLPARIVQGRIRGQAIAAIDVGRIPDGSYRGRSPQAGFDYEVSVVIAAHRIARVVVERNREGLYATLAAGVARKIERAGRIDVDAVTGATTSSRALQKAAEAALTR